MGRLELRWVVEVGEWGASILDTGQV